MAINRDPRKGALTSKGPGRRALESAPSDFIMPRDHWGHDAKPPWYRVKTLTAAQMVEVMEAVANGRSMLSAATAAGTTLWAVQRQRIADEGFGLAMNEAIALRQVAIEEKAIELAMEGEIETVIKGETEYTRKTYPSNSLLQRLLSAYFPETFGTDRSEVKAGPLDTPPQVVRNKDDRQKLLDRIAARHILPKPKGEVIDVEAEEASDEPDPALLDLL